MNCFLVPPRTSNAPALMRFSTSRLFISSRLEILVIKSSRFLNSPSSFLSFTMARITGRKKKELWIQFPDKETYLEEEAITYGYLADSEGNDIEKIIAENYRNAIGRK